VVCLLLVFVCIVFAVVFGLKFYNIVRVLFTTTVLLKLPYAASLALGLHSCEAFRMNATDYLHVYASAVCQCRTEYLGCWVCMNTFASQYILAKFHLLTLLFDDCCEAWTTLISFIYLLNIAKEKTCIYLGFYNLMVTMTQSRRVPMHQILLSTWNCVLFQFCWLVLLDCQSF